ncbi:MAG: TonB-dependent receptor [Lentisphaeria bacterium]
MKNWQRNLSQKLKRNVIGGSLAAAVLSAGYTSGASEGKGGSESDSEARNLDDLIVTATQTETPLSELGYSVSVIDRTEIENSNFNYVTEILKTVPGVDFRTNGPHSNSSTLSIRGLEGYHTKVLINGIPIQDTSGPQVKPVLNGLLLDNIERIEVVRGASSTLYGSNAMAGVINIITRSGEQEGMSGEFETEVGSHDYQRLHGSVRGKSGRVSYSFSSSFLTEDGISAQADVMSTDTDNFQTQSHSGRLGIDLGDNLRLNVFGRYSDTDEEFDSGYYSTWAGTYVFDDSGEWHIQNALGGLELQASDLWERWDTSFTYSLSENQRGRLDAKRGFTGLTEQFKWQNELRENAWNKTVFGYEYTGEEAETTAGLDERHRTNSYFLQHQTEPLANLFLTGGLRYNDHSVFGEETTYSTSAAYLIDSTGTKLQASYSTGYRSPSLNELFGLYGPNPDLSPETSETWDVGFEQGLFEEKVQFGVTYFDTRVEDYIEYDFMAGYTQVTGIKTHGIESFVTLNPIPTLSLRLAHTWQDTTNMDTDDELAYRPDNKTSATLNYRFLDNRANLNLNALYVGRRAKSAWDGGPARVDDYLLANLSASYQLTDNVEIFGRIRNLLNEDYEVVRNFNTYDRSYYGGVKLSF